MVNLAKVTERLVDVMITACAGILR
jgi:hypothetical protein